MGKVNAAIVTTLLADRFGCRTIVFSAVVADRIIQHDAGVLENEKIRDCLPGWENDSTDSHFRARSSTAQSLPAIST
jgi:nucleoside phosphorylase